MARCLRRIPHPDGAIVASENPPVGGAYRRQGVGSAAHWDAGVANSLSKLIIKRVHDIAA